MKKETKPIFVRVSIDLKKKIEKMAEYKGLTISSLVRYYLIEKLREDEKQMEDNGRNNERNIK
jgi:hypothetical protein